ncbi:hypothetical protein M3Y96_00828700 [Aphelenchoides besseyi]|nr:hypothetical protein M3Y96_00828700 [Aphelenchoides besseyi]
MRPLTVDGVMKRLPSSAVVRARITPDVIGIDRYKHFHRPLVSESVVGKVDGGNIDKKGFIYHNELPAIKYSKSTASSNKSSIRHQESSSTQSSGSHHFNRNKQHIPPIDDKAKRLKSSDSTSLPPINGNANKTLKKKQVNGVVQRNPNKGTNSGPTKARTQPLYQKLQRRARSVNTMKISSTNNRLHTSWDGHKPDQSNVKNFGTQTDFLVQTQVTSATPPILTSTPEFTARSNPESKSSNTPKATQTTTLSVLTRLTARSADNIRDIEERSELMQIIDNALDETIDKHSRQRANYFIASSARNIENIWKDAKLFVSTVLLPQSVSLANKTKSKKTPLDAIATVHLP